MLSPDSTTQVKTLKLYPVDQNFVKEKLLAEYGW
jgi:sulfur relay (sulfurtransferase) DsrF/TusC family protein